jgi:hypothetical protein
MGMVAFREFIRVCAGVAEAGYLFGSPSHKKNLYILCVLLRSQYCENIVKLIGNHNTMFVSVVLDCDC